MRRGRGGNERLSRGIIWRGEGFITIEKGVGKQDGSGSVPVLKWDGRGGEVNLITIMSGDFFSFSLLLFFLWSSLLVTERGEAGRRGKRKRRKRRVR